MRRNLKSEQEKFTFLAAKRGNWWLTELLPPEEKGKQRNYITYLTIAGPLFHPGDIFSRRCDLQPQTAKPNYT